MLPFEMRGAVFWNEHSLKFITGHCVRALSQCCFTLSIPSRCVPGAFPFPLLVADTKRVISDYPDVGMQKRWFWTLIYVFAAERSFQ